ncbi:hypothetical protein [Streptomyces sp. NBC_01443]|uniref:hypothetical protein n=1 Tax=Streptomyces sp. NBC_01443 TaxID=2903868 RepID=UPI002251903F|nr:hypothetical protein [Streptomyces sp. NBC_01443]
MPGVITALRKRVTLLEWTVEGKPSRRTAPDGTVRSWTYDGEGKCLTYADAAGGTTC